MIYTVFDLIVLLILFSSIILGIIRGAVFITINFLGFLSSIVIAYLLYPAVKGIFSEVIKHEVLLPVISAILIYLASLLLFTLLSSKLVLLATPFRGSFIDKIFGLFLGGIRGVIINFIIFLFLAIFSTSVYYEAHDFKTMVLDLSEQKYPSWLRESYTTEYLENGVKYIVNNTPEKYLDYIKFDNNLGKSEDDIECEDDNINIEEFDIQYESR